jgi:predicted nucleotidyltransferase
MMQPIFKKYVIPYTGENGISLYNRRMVHMPYTQYEVLIKQENRKLQGLTKEKGIHINCQPLWKDGIDPLCDSEIYTIGEISCTLEIEDDTNSFFSPVYTKLKWIQ